MSILGALTWQGPLEPMCINGSTTGPVFLTFLDHFLVPHLWPGAVVVMDHLSAHKVKGVREKIAAAGAPLLYLSAYSPDCNPIEMAWSKLKTSLRKVAARPSATLDKAIAQGWRAVSADDARDCYRSLRLLLKLIQTGLALKPTFQTPSSCCRRAFDWRR